VPVRADPGEYRTPWPPHASLYVAIVHVGGANEPYVDSATSLILARPLGGGRISIVDLNLFRVKAFLPPLFAEQVRPADAVRRAVEEKPTAVIGARGGRWHIGNVQVLDDNGLYFALGRTSRATVQLLDPRTGDFLEAERETAPYTHVVLDVPREVCAIARKTNLAPNSLSLGHNLARVLNASSIAQRYGATFQVAPLSDPEDFVRMLQSAYAIRRFTVTFARFNPFDAEEDWHKPMQRLADAANGQAGSTSLKGPALNEAPLEALTRSVASTGDDARALLLLEEGQSPVRRSLRRDTATITERDVETIEERRSVLAKLRAKYREIRGRAG
jgi:hypothetical protein